MRIRSGSLSGITKIVCIAVLFWSVSLFYGPNAHPAQGPGSFADLVEAVKRLGGKHFDHPDAQGKPYGAILGAEFAFPRLFRR